MHSLNELALASWHQEMGARFAAVNDTTVVDHYGDPAEEFLSLKNNAGILDLSFRGRLCITGADRQRFLNGQVTNDVKSLQPGRGCYTALADNKGKILGDAFLHVLAGEMLVDVEPGYAGTVSERFEKFIIADDVQVLRVEAHYGLLSVQGPMADEALLSAAISPALPEKKYHSVYVADSRFGEICIANVPRTGSKGYDLYIPTPHLQNAITQLLGAAARISGRLAGWQALETARIEAGIPRFGADMDASNLVPETGLQDHAVSYTKGCYTGQEVIARIRTQGRVNKSLRGLILSNEVKVLPKRADKILLGGQEIGYVTSAIYSPTLKTNVALGYVRREHSQPDTELEVHTADFNYPARVVSLPFC